MGRHGMHSPFVYALVEDCIQKNRQIPLLTRIKEFLKDWPLTEWSALQHNEWERLVDALPKENKERRMIIVEGIRNSRSHTDQWNGICSRKEISYSLDLYDFGLLFISNDFKEKQHFILKK
jgi:hypothetical protein